MGGLLSCLLLAAGLVTAHPTRAAAVTCTEVIGFSQTAGWFETSEFQAGVDQSQWQLRWESGGDMLQWSAAQVGGSTGVYWDRPVAQAHDGHGAHVCAFGSTAPDRVIYTATRAQYIDYTDNFWTTGYLDGVYRNIKLKYPNALVFFQTLVAGPALNRCDFPLSDPTQTQPYVRASWNAPVIDAAMTYELAQHPDIQIAIQPEVTQCTEYFDWGGHLTATGYGSAGQRIAASYRSRFGLPFPTATPTATPTSAPPTSSPTSSPTPTASPTPSSTPVQSGTNLLGDDQIEATVDGNPRGDPEANRFTAAAGTVTRIGIYLDQSNAATALELGIYSDNGNGSAPGTLLASGTLAGLVNGAWNTVTIPSLTLTAGTTYWIARFPTAGGTLATRVAQATNADRDWAGQSPTLLPTIWTSPGGSYPHRTSMFASP